MSPEPCSDGLCGQGSRLPLGPIVATVQLDEWAPSRIDLSTGVLLVSLDPMIEKVGTNDSKVIYRDHLMEVSDYYPVLSTIDFKPRDSSETERW